MAARRKLVGSHLLCAASDGRTRTILGSFFIKETSLVFLERTAFCSDSEGCCIMQQYCLIRDHL